MTRGVTKRLRDLLRNLPPPIAMVVFTYPGDYPEDKSLCDKHRKRIMQELRRWELARLMGWYGIWRRERQRRGAAHWHVLIFGKEDADGRCWTLPRGGWRGVREWLRERWYRIVGSEDPKHREQGVDVSPVKNPERTINYTIGEMSKADQAGLPKGWTSWGRQWGKWGRVPPLVPRFTLEGRPAVEGARIAVKARRARRRAWGKGKRPFRWNGGGATVYDTRGVVTEWTARMSTAPTQHLRLTAEPRPPRRASGGDGGETVLRGG